MTMRAIPETSRFQPRTLLLNAGLYAAIASGVFVAETRIELYPFIDEMIEDEESFEADVGSSNGRRVW